MPVVTEHAEFLIWDDKQLITCNRCRKKMSSDNFFRAEGFANGFDCLCKECRHEVRIVDHLTSKQIIELVHKKKDRAVCNDCGAAGMPAKAMRLVYRSDEKKSFSLSKPPRELDIVSVLTEIRKCDLLCANCASLKK